MSTGPRYTASQAREAVAASLTYTEALRRLGMRPAGGNYKTLQKYIARWGISTDHFNPNARRRSWSRARARPIEEILVQDSSFARGHLKQRLYSEGIKQRRCEICGQGEEWLGRRISLILDHVNGIATDNRLHNLRIVCPNCAAALPTHCGRNIELIARRACVRCGESFQPRAERQRYCSRTCGLRSPGPRGPRPERRRAVRPPVRQLLCEIEDLGYAAVGRKYGVSDNAIRKWVRAEGIAPPRVLWTRRRRS